MPRTLRPSHRAVAATFLALALAIGAPRVAHGAAIVEFATRCADGDTLGSFIEILGNPSESTRNGMRLRAQDHDFATVFDIDAYGQRGGEVFTFQEGRRFLLATAPLIASIGFQWGPAPFGYADNILPFALDPIGGRLQLYLIVNGREQIVSQVPYGPRLLAPAPPPGLSAFQAPGNWQIDPHPVMDAFFHTNLNGNGPAPPCFTAPDYRISSVRLQCEDGGTRGQFLEIESFGPTGNLHEQISLQAFDHTGALIGTSPSGFSTDPGSSAFTTRHWLMAGPDFVSGSADTADARLPFTLDPTGGALQLVVSVGALSWSSDAFSYGTSFVPLPLTGLTYVRLPGSSISTGVIIPHNSRLAVVEVPQCAAGTGIGHPVLQELALACSDGLPQGQFIELSSRGSSLAMNDAYRLRHLRRDGSLAFQLDDVFAGLPSSALARDRDWLLIPASDPRSARADPVLPDTLDRVAGALELYRVGLSGDSLVLRQEWGGAPLVRPPDGGSLDASTLLPNMIAYPTPTTYAKVALPHDDCTADRDPAALSVLRSALDCVDGSRAAAFVELDHLSSALVRDTRLGLRWLASNGTELLRVEPLFPPRADWDLTASPHWLVAGPGFEGRAGLAPDVIWPTPLVSAPATIELYRRDPVSGAATTMGSHPMQAVLLGAGHGELRTPSGQYESDAVVSPQRFDGGRVASGSCWSTPHPEAVRLAAMLVQCRDGGRDGQYVQLAALGSESMYSRDLLLRVRDHAGVTLGSLRAPFPAAFTGRTWPRDRALLIGAPGFASAMGVAADATLPATLDTLGGRIELALAPDGLPEVPLDALDYGPQGIAPPPPGAALVAADGTWHVEAFPRAEGIGVAIAAPTACLGECPGRSVQFAVGGVRTLTQAAGELTDTDARFTFDGTRGVFDLDAALGAITVRWDDRFVLDDAASRAPRVLFAKLRSIATTRDSCPRQSPTCLSSHATASLTSADGADATTEGPSHHDLRVAIQVTPGQPFDLSLALQTSAIAAPPLAARELARLEFEGLTAGMRVRSCSGFDSRAQRGIADPVVVNEPRRITVSWPVRGDLDSAWTIERRVDAGDWQTFETRTADADHVLRVADTRVAAGHRYEYRVTWSDAFDVYASPVAGGDAAAQPGYAFDGITPNPSTGVFDARLEIPEAGLVRLDVLDIAGRLAASQSVALAAGAHRVPLTTDGALAPGIYTVRMRYRGLVSWSRVVVLR